MDSNNTGATSGCQTKGEGRKEELSVSVAGVSSCFRPRWLKTTESHRRTAEGKKTPTRYVTSSKLFTVDGYNGEQNH